jgi:hypothetical protein
MFANARKFNGDGSWVVEDWQAVEKELERALKKNGFSDEHVPTSKKTKLRIKLSLKFLRVLYDASWLGSSLIVGTRSETTRQLC